MSIFKSKEEKEKRRKEKEDKERKKNGGVLMTVSPEWPSFKKEEVRYAKPPSRGGRSSAPEQRIEEIETPTDPDS
ncbi:MAG: hypothetical protein LBT41_05805 [Candidatus Methanoplasma sp.]|jgi:hypothetical protein|nr:hypothetical protein [Candidatus Methanoplasma sp.]